MTPAPPLLEAKDLVRRYRMRRGLFGRAVELRAVDGVSLRLERGRTLGLVGEPGCGRSTTGRLVLGMEVPDAGSVAFAGRPLPAPGSAAWRAQRARMQMVFQDPLGALDRRLPIGAQVAEPLEIHGIGDRAGRAARVEALLKAVGLRPDHALRYPHELSGGQRQRAVRQVSQRVAVMYLGRIVEEGEADALLQDPALPYTRTLVSAIPHPGRRGGRIILQGDPPNPADRPPGCASHPRCPVAVAICAREAPSLKPRGDGRLVACHLAHGHAALPRRAA
jgi:peptide/nickel transport system ATP-binding protein